MLKAPVGVNSSPGASRLTWILAQGSLARWSIHCFGDGSMQGPAQRAPWCCMHAGLQKHMSPMLAHHAAGIKHLSSRFWYAWLSCEPRSSLCACRALASVRSVQGRQTLDGVQGILDTETEDNTASGDCFTRNSMRARRAYAGGHWSEASGKILRRSLMNSSTGGIQHCCCVILM